MATNLSQVFDNHTAKPIPDFKKISSQISIPDKTGKGNLADNPGYGLFKTLASALVQDVMQAVTNTVFVPSPTVPTVDGGLAAVATFKASLMANLAALSQEINNL